MMIQWSTKYQNKVGSMQLNSIFGKNELIKSARDISNSLLIFCTLLNTFENIETKSNKKYWILPKWISLYPPVVWWRWCLNVALTFENLECFSAPT